MSRTVKKENETIEFREKVKEPSGRNIFINGVNLHSVNGDLYKKDNPGWFQWKVVGDKIKKDGSREKNIKLTVNSTHLKENVNYVFQLIASNGREKTKRNVSLSVVFSLDKSFVEIDTPLNFDFKKLDDGFQYDVNRVRSNDFSLTTKKVNGSEINRVCQEVEISSSNILLKM